MRVKGVMAHSLMTSPLKGVQLWDPLQQCERIITWLMLCLGAIHTAQIMLLLVLLVALFMQTLGSTPSLLRDAFNLE